MEQQKSNKNIGNKAKRFVNLILNSAPFALLLSILFFWYENIKNDKDVNKLLENLTLIEQSLSTRHIGIFPDYLDQINTSILNNIEDSTHVVIFEDVLFYGAFYNGKAFRDMVLRLSEISKRGNVTIAFYDNSKDVRIGRMFREVVKESWLAQEDLQKLEVERRSIVSSLQTLNKDRGMLLNEVDSTLCEKYFERYKQTSSREYSNRINAILSTPFSPLKTEIDNNIIFNKLVYRPSDIK